MRWLAFTVAAVGLTACFDFQRAIADCEDAGACQSGSSGLDGGPAPEDAGTDAGTDAGWHLTDNFDAGVTVFALWANSPREAWAGADFGNFFGWNGTTWAPLPSPVQVDGVTGVWSDGLTLWTVTNSGFSTSQCWYQRDAGWVLAGAVNDGLNGVMGADGGVWAYSTTAIYREVLDGGGGQLVPVWVDDAGVAPQAIWANRANDVWVATSAGPLHFDGAAWTLLDAGVPGGFNSVWADSSSDVWLDGPGGSMVRWTGQWNAFRDFLGPGNYFFTLSGTGANDVWAGAAGGYLFHWDGAAWRGIDTSYDNSFDTYVVVAPSPAEVWVVESTGGFPYTNSFIGHLHR